MYIYAIYIYIPYSRTESTQRTEEGQKQGDASRLRVVTPLRPLMTMIDYVKSGGFTPHPLPLGFGFRCSLASQAGVFLLAVGRGHARELLARHLPYDGRRHDELHIILELDVRLGILRHRVYNTAVAMGAVVRRRGLLLRCALAEGPGHQGRELVAPVVVVVPVTVVKVLIAVLMYLLDFNIILSSYEIGQRGWKEGDQQKHPKRRRDSDTKYHDTH